MTIDSHLLAKILEHLHGDGCTFSYVREVSGLNKPDAERLLAELGAKRDSGSANSQRYRIPNLARKEHSNPRVKMVGPSEAARLMRDER